MDFRTSTSTEKVRATLEEEEEGRDCSWQLEFAGLHKLFLVLHRYKQSTQLVLIETLFHICNEVLEHATLHDSEVPKPHPVFVTFCSTVYLAFFFFSFATEYLQQMRDIAALKNEMPMSYACTETTASNSFSWLHSAVCHVSGLQDL